MTVGTGRERKDQLCTDEQQKAVGGEDGKRGHMMPAVGGRAPVGKRLHPAQNGRCRSILMQRYASFAEFYSFYLSEHANRTTRRLHFLGSAWRLFCLLELLFTGNVWWLAVGPCLRLRLCLAFPSGVRKEPARHLPPAALQLHGRLGDVLANPDGQNRVLSAEPARHQEGQRDQRPGLAVGAEELRQFSALSMSSFLTCHNRCAPAAAASQRRTASRYVR